MQDLVEPGCGHRMDRSQLRGGRECGFRHCEVAGRSERDSCAAGCKMGGLLRDV
jgi:hypothetical protein